MLKVYTYKNCDTCRKATKFLQDQGVSFEEIPIRESPPTLAELNQMLEAHEGEMRKLFNTSGVDYRTHHWKDRLPVISKNAAFKALRENGNLVKRPFLIGRGIALVGFDAKTWSQALASSR
jgi:arsenate reductase (glutaredoxin)